MKIFALLALLVTVTTHAAQIGVPFSPEADQRFDIIENPASAIVMPQGSLKGPKGHNGSYVAHFAKDILSINKAVGTYNSDIALPAGAIIERVYALVDTTTAGGSFAVQCVGAGDMIATTAAGATAGSIVAGVPVGSPSTMVYSSAGCTVKYVVSVGTMTAGKIELFVDYVVAK